MNLNTCIILTVYFHNLLFILQITNSQIVLDNTSFGTRLVHIDNVHVFAKFTCDSKLRRIRWVRTLYVRDDELAIVDILVRIYDMLLVTHLLDKYKTSYSLALNTWNASLCCIFHKINSLLCSTFIK